MELLFIHNECLNEQQQIGDEHQQNRKMDYTVMNLDDGVMMVSILI
jgi:hypothetical protein